MLSIAQQGKDSHIHYRSLKLDHMKLLAFFWVKMIHE